MDKREQIARTLVEQFKLEFFDKKELLQLVDWYRISDQILALFPEPLVGGIEKIIYTELKRQYKGRLPPNLRISDLALALSKLQIKGEEEETIQKSLCEICKIVRDCTVRFSTMGIVNKCGLYQPHPEVKGEGKDDKEIYPCADCGKMRSKNQGGTTFTVCEECWDKHYKKPHPEVKEEGKEHTFLGIPIKIDKTIPERMWYLVNDKYFPHPENGGVCSHTYTAGQVSYGKEYCIYCGKSKPLPPKPEGVCECNKSAVLKIGNIVGTKCFNCGKEIKPLPPQETEKVEPLNEPTKEVREFLLRTDTNLILMWDKINQLCRAFNSAQGEER